MKRTPLSLLALFFLSITAFGQTLNPSIVCDNEDNYNPFFEQHPLSVSAYNIDNPAFTMLMDSVAGFGMVGGANGRLSILRHSDFTTATGIDSTSVWFIAMREGGEAISIRMRGADIQAGRDYCPTVLARRLFGSNVPMVEFGISNSPNSFGTSVVSSTDTLHPDWFTHVEGFTAPHNAQYITIRTIGASPSLSALDFFGFAATLPAGNISYGARRISAEEALVEWEYNQYEGEVWLEKRDRNQQFERIGSGFLEKGERGWKRHTFTDFNAGPGVVDYRLGFRDLNGTESNSDEFQLEAANLTGNLNIYPNPAGDRVNFNVNGSFLEGKWSVEVYDQTGKLQMELSGENFSEESFAVNQWDSGIYLVKFSHNGKTETRKLVVE